MTEKTVSQLICGDSIEKMETMDSGSIDLIIADPPFGIDHFKENTAYNRIKKFVLGGYVEILNSEYDEFSDRWIAQSARLLTKTGSMYVVSGWSNLEDVLRALRQNKLHMINHIIWQYPFGVYTKKKYVTSHYHVLYVGKSKHRRTFNREAFFRDGVQATSGGSLNYKHREDVWDIKRENWSGKVKTQNKLPRELVEKMIVYSSNPGDLVLDPFMGSGQVPYIAKAEMRRYIGIEISEEVYKFAKYRVESGDYYGKEYK